MNEEIRDVLKKNVGKGVVIYFHNILDSYRSGTGYEMGIIEEITDTLVKIKYKSLEEKKGLFSKLVSGEYLSTTYIDISSIRAINFSDPDFYDENGQYRY